MVLYRELAPSRRLAAEIECYWTIDSTAPEFPHRVLPDGCADILFTQQSGGATLEAIGPMTAYSDFILKPDLRMVGVRFRPGAWTGHLRTPGNEVTDQILPLESLWGSRVSGLIGELAEASSVEQFAQRFEAALCASPAPGPLQRALAWMEQRHGCVSMDELARHTGWSPRQLRRVCLEQTGLTPKFLARVTRFRRALAELHRHPGAFAGFALDCGYYDQAHFINECRELSGRTPSALCG